MKIDMYLQDTGRNLKRESGLKNITNEVLKHQAGVDLYKVPELLGHKDIKTTQQRYAHHCPDSLRDGVEILETDYNLTTIEEKKDKIVNS